MSKGIKKTNNKITMKPKKFSSKKESKDKQKRYFFYHFVKNYRNIKPKIKKDNYSSNNFWSTKPTIIDLELIDTEHHQSLYNTIISDIIFANWEESHF